jgi:hypothetical protein
MTFEELATRFEEDFPNLDLAQGEVFHYIKLFQHASSYHALNDSRKLIPKTIDSQAYSLRLIYAVKQLIRRPKQPRLKAIGMLDDKRTVDTTDGRKSYYFDRILREIGYDYVSVINDSKKQTALPVSVDRTQLQQLENFALDATDKRVLNDLLMVLSRAKGALVDQPNLYAYLASAFTVFFADFHRYHHLFTGQKTRRLLVTTHYHHEGLIAAAKINGIEVIEFQHGLIAEQDLYYCYPKAIANFRESALFADHICVFGRYWKNLLLKGSEYTDSNTHILGDYSLRSMGRQQYLRVDKSNALLVAAQKNCVDEYLGYVERLIPLFERNYPDWEIWVKLHPLEREPEAYEKLKNHKQCTVYGRESDLMELLAKCRIQVSIYSTTLYDALGLNVVNLSLQNYGRSSDYAKAMVTEHIALGIHVEDDPIEVAERTNPNHLLRESDVYATFDPTQLRNLIA